MTTPVFSGEPAVPVVDQTTTNDAAVTPVTDSVPTTNDAPEIPGADDFNADDYEYVRIGGTVRAIPKSQIVAEAKTATQDAPAPTMVAKKEAHFYVHLANGDVVRVKESDLPVSAGTNAAQGHWQRDDKVFLIIGVYPVEDIVEGYKN